MRLNNSVAKTIIESLFNAVYEDTDLNNINVYSEDISELKVTTLKEMLPIDFYTYSKNELARGFYGANEEEQENYIETIANNMQETKALVELNSVEPLASPNIDGGNFRTTITFFIPSDKVAYLDLLATRIRDKYKGVFETYVDYSANALLNKNYGYNLLISFDNLQIQDTSFYSPIGMANICTLNVDFGYMQSCDKYETTRIQLSTDGTNYYQCPLISFDLSTQYTTQLNTLQNNPKCVGDLVTSATIGFSMSFYAMNYGIFQTLRTRCMGICDTSKSSDTDLSNIIYVKIYYSDSEYYVYKCNVRSYTTKYVNSDFTQVSLVLGLNAQE